MEGQTRGVSETNSDKMIIPGDKWRKEIQSAIESAKIAILLISADFLASDFITRKRGSRTAEGRRANRLSHITYYCWALSIFADASVI
jgi:hypothetical protein